MSPVAQPASREEDALAATAADGARAPRRLDGRRALAVAALGVVLCGLLALAYGWLVGMHQYRDGGGLTPGWGWRRHVATHVASAWWLVVIAPVLAAAASLAADALGLRRWPLRTALMAASLCLLWAPHQIQWLASGHGLNLGVLPFGIGLAGTLAAVLEAFAPPIGRARIARGVLTALAALALAALAVVAILVATVPEPPGRIVP